MTNAIVLIDVESGKANEAARAVAEIRGVREVSAWCRTLAAGGKAVAIITHDNLLAALAGDAVVELKG